MNGGTISGNIAEESGGGVSTHDGTVYMKGGTIGGNTAKNDFGGGVFGYQSEFIKTGGIIYGRNAESNSNYAGRGGNSIYLNFRESNATFNESDNINITKRPSIF
jgi:hypothetical protein